MLIYIVRVKDFDFASYVIVNNKIDYVHKEKLIGGKIPWRFSSNSETNASELLENLERMFPLVTDSILRPQTGVML